MSEKGSSDEKIYTAHDATEFLAWLMAPQTEDDIRHVYIANKTITIDLSLLSCDKWTYTVHEVKSRLGVDKWLLTLKRE